jgi:DNA-binding MarR family transcriptional regulator
MQNGHRQTAFLTKSSGSFCGAPINLPLSQSAAEFLEIGVTANGVAVSDFVVLEVLQHNGAMKAAEIAQKTRLSAASVEVIIVRLFEQGLIEHRPSRAIRDDKRILQLTDQGSGCIAGIYEEHAKDNETVFNTLSTEQRLELYRSLKEVGHSAARRRALPAANHNGG